MEKSASSKNKDKDLGTEELNKKFEEIKEDLKEMKDLNNSLDKPMELGDTKERYQGQYDSAYRTKYAQCYYHLSCQHDHAVRFM